MKLNDYKATLNGIKVSEERKECIKKDLLFSAKADNHVITFEKRSVFSRKPMIPLIAGFSFIVFEIVVLSLFINRQDTDSYINQPVNPASSVTENTVTETTPAETSVKIDSSVSEDDAYGLPVISTDKDGNYDIYNSDNYVNDWDNVFPYNSEYTNVIDDMSGFMQIFNNGKPQNEEQLLEKLYDEPVYKELEFENVKTLDISLLSGNVEIKRGGDSGKVIINYYEWTENEFVTEEKDGKLTFKYNQQYYLQTSNGSQGNWVDYLLEKKKIKQNPDNPNQGSRMIYLTIPDDIKIDITQLSGNTVINDCNIKSLSRSSTSGNLKLKNCDADSLNIQSTSGNININDCSITEADIQMTSGNFTSVNNTYNNLDITITSGNISIEGNKAEKAEISTVGGNISCKNNELKRLSVNCTSGNVVLNNNRIDDKLAVSDISGGIEVNGGSANRIEINSNSGSVELKNISNVMKYDLNTFSSDVNIATNETEFGEYTVNSSRSVYVNGEKTKNIKSDGERVINFETYSGRLYIEYK